MQTSLPVFDDARLPVSGGLILDRYCYGATGRISPDAPVPAVHGRGVEQGPGGIGTVVLHQAAAPVVVESIWGDESGGEVLPVDGGVVEVLDFLEGHSRRRCSRVGTVVKADGCGI